MLLVAQSMKSETLGSFYISLHYALCWLAIILLIRGFTPYEYMTYRGKSLSPSTLRKT
jgi:hypothetical protein